ncbi:MAG TPA: peroxiredoxin [Candidatus Acidoferrum sp.]|nr:peroxiredoxin [Candidatus Acidoferrum sp.]
MLKAGEKAPAFRATSDDGSTVSLADYKGKNLVLYFYPKANTSGCTHEAVEFSTALDEFKSANTAVVGCSGDSIESQTKFKTRYGINFPLLADTNFEVIEAYDARRMKTFFGKSFLGIVRMTFWISPDGKIRKVWEKVTPKGHAAEVLAAIREG